MKKLIQIFGVVVLGSLFLALRLVFLPASLLLSWCDDRVVETMDALEPYLGLDDDDRK